MHKNLQIILIILLGYNCQQMIEVQENYDDLNKEINQKEVIPLNESNQAYKNVWEYLKQNNTNTNNVNLNKETLFYMNMHLKDIDSFKEYLNDSYYFIFFVIDELNQAELPIELSLIPFIESNYDPFSISSSGAVGMWQFMPITGKYYDLDKSWWNEDRHDPFKSSKAAVEYLGYLYNRFDKNINITLAAYNAGPSYIEKKIKQNKRKGLQFDYWSLELPKQTEDYVPKYLALKELVFNPEKYGVVLPEIPFLPVVEKIIIPGQVEIIALSEYLEIKPELLYKLNAGYTKWASAPKDESIFYIPANKYHLYKDENNPFINSNQINWISHTIQKGDNLWDLSIKYDTEVKIILEINGMKSNLLSIGDNLIIPLGKTKSNNFIPYEMHIVSEGDTLWNISRSYNIEIKDIIQMNNIQDDSYLQLGQQLSIGNKNIHRNMDSKKRTILYSVKQGDNLYKISQLFDVSIKSIEEINILKDATLMPGQIIKISIKAF